MSVPSIAYLPSQLPDTVNELNENRGAVCICVVLIAMTDALKEKTEEKRTSSDATEQATALNIVSKMSKVKIVKMSLPAGSDDQNSATLSQAEPRSHEWCGSNHPAWAWPRRWAGQCGPSRRCSAPPPRFSQTPPCLRSAVPQLGSAANTHTNGLVKRLRSEIFGFFCCCCF